MIDKSKFYKTFFLLKKNKFRQTSVYPKFSHTLLKYLNTTYFYAITTKIKERILLISFSKYSSIFLNWALLGTSNNQNIFILSVIKFKVKQRVLKLVH